MKPTYHSNKLHRFSYCNPAAPDEVDAIYADLSNPRLIAKEVEYLGPSFSDKSLETLSSHYQRAAELRGINLSSEETKQCVQSFIPEITQYSQDLREGKSPLAFQRTYVGKVQKKHIKDLKAEGGLIDSNGLFYSKTVEPEDIMVFLGKYDGLRFKSEEAFNQYIEEETAGLDAYDKAKVTEYFRSYLFEMPDPDYPDDPEKCWLISAYGCGNRNAMANTAFKLDGTKHVIDQNRINCHYVAIDEQWKDRNGDIQKEPCVGLFGINPRADDPVLVNYGDKFGKLFDDPFSYERALAEKVGSASYSLNDRVRTLVNFSEFLQSRQESPELLRIAYLPDNKWEPVRDTYLNQVKEEHREIQKDILDEFRSWQANWAVDVPKKR